MAWTVEEAALDHMNRTVDYQLGFSWMRPAVPAILTKKQAALARQMAYHWLRENFPERFPKGHRFN